MSSSMSRNVCLKIWAVPSWGENFVSNQGGYRSGVLMVSTLVPRMTVPHDTPSRDVLQYGHSSSYISHNSKYNLRVSPQLVGS